MHAFGRQTDRQTDERTDRKATAIASSNKVRCALKIANIVWKIIADKDTKLKAQTASQLPTTSQTPATDQRSSSNCTVTVRLVSDV